MEMQGTFLWKLQVLDSVKARKKIREVCDVNHDVWPCFDDINILKPDCKALAILHLCGLVHWDNFVLYQDRTVQLNTFAYAITCFMALH